MAKVEEKVVLEIEEFHGKSPNSIRQELYAMGAGKGWGRKGCAAFHGGESSDRISGLSRSSTAFQGGATVQIGLSPNW
jgi:hypothetical protein